MSPWSTRRDKNIQFEFQRRRQRTGLLVDEEAIGRGRGQGFLRIGEAAVIVVGDEGDAKQPPLVFLSFRRAAAEGREVSL